MKRKLSLILSTVFLVLSCIIPFQVFASKNLDAPYNYPVLPGTAEWADFTTRDQKIAVCQIPEPLLENMSTKSLALTVLNYPLLNDYIAYNDHLLAAENMAMEFNGYRELLQREDINAVLLDLYEESEVYTENKATTFRDTSEELYNYFLVPNIEYLLAYSQVYGNILDDTQQETFASELANKCQVRFDSNQFSQTSYEYIYFWGSVNDKNKISTQDIVLPIQPLAGENRSYTYISTPKGSSIQTIYNQTPELTTSQKDYYNRTFASAYPNATLISDPTVKYNCHSFAWYQQSIFNQHWLNQYNSDDGANLSKYWTDGSYRQTSSSNSEGVRVFYSNGDHSALFRTRTVVNGSPTWIYWSKWGPGGLYNHTLYDCPYSTSGLRYYS